MIMQHTFPATDWFAYTNHKIIALQDPTSFDCGSSWEINFLVSVLQKTFPHVSEEIMKVTISDCGQNFSSPVNRDQFVRCVMEAIDSKE